MKLIKYLALLIIVGIIFFAPIFRVPGSMKVTCISTQGECEEWDHESLFNKSMN
jgi:hypothetical protein